MPQLVAVKRFLRHCSHIFHHTIMLFDWQIALKVYSEKFWSVTCTFFNTIFIHIQMQLRRYATISCRKTVFAALQSHFPSHNNVIWLTNCFESLQWKILVGDMYFFQYNFHPHTNAINCGKLQKNGITIWWSNRWFVLNSIVFSIYLSQSHLWQNIPKHVGDPTWKFIQSLFVM